MSSHIEFETECPECGFTMTQKASVGQKLIRIHCSHCKHGYDYTHIIRNYKEVVDLPPEELKKHLVEQHIVVGPHYWVQGSMTVCYFKLNNGYEQIGTAAVSNEAEFNETIGQKYAYADAINKAAVITGIAAEVNKMHV